MMFTSEPSLITLELRHELSEFLSTKIHVDRKYLLTRFETNEKLWCVSDQSSNIGNLNQRELLILARISSYHNHQNFTKKGQSKSSLP